MGQQDRDYMYRNRYGAPPDRVVSRLKIDPVRTAAKWAFGIFFAVMIFAAGWYAGQGAKDIAPFPETGAARWFVAKQGLQSSQVAELRLKAPTTGKNYMVRLDDWQTGSPVVSIPVRSGDLAKISMPIGRYRFYMSSGKFWIGGKFLFSNNEMVAVDPLEFYVDNQRRVIGGNILLESFSGNMKMKSVNSIF